MRSDEITLTIPGDEDVRRVAHLVIGGLAVRIDLTWENLEDLQLALDTLLTQREDEEDGTGSVRVESGVVTTTVGPFEGRVVSELTRDDAPLGIRRILDTVCDGYEIREDDGGHWIELTKQVQRAA